MKDAYSFDVDRDALMRELRRDVRGVRAHLHAAGAQVPRRRGRHRRDRRQSRRTSSRCSPSPARTRSPGARSRGYAANVEQAEAVAPAASARRRRRARCARCRRPGQSTCEDVAALLGLPLARSVKCLMIYAQDNGRQMLLVRGDHMGNEIKIGKLPGLGPWRWATRRRDRRGHRLPARAISGPVGLAAQRAADRRPLASP